MVEAPVEWMKKSRNLLLAVCISFCLLSLAPAAMGQLADANLSGTTRDESGAVIPGVSITATNKQTGSVRTSVTNEEGRYSILSVPPGIYDVQAELPGFATSVQRGREFLVGTTVTLDITLRV